LDKNGPEYQVGLAEIVGIAGDVRERLNLDASPVMYQLPSQIPAADLALLNSYERTTLLVRARPGIPVMSIGKSVESLLLANYDLPAVAVRPMSEVSLASTARQNFTLLLLAIFAALALLLAVIGVYGVMSYAVEQRTQEIGIRAALGANSRDTLRLFLVQAMQIAVVGVASGLAGATILTRFLASQLFAVHPLDPLTFVVAPLVLLTVAVFAAFLPALRAARLDPLRALRHE
jgi:ABC-type antimicrobial peptide transport system permease subunit